MINHGLASLLDIVSLTTISDAGAGLEAHAHVTDIYSVGYSTFQHPYAGLLPNLSTCSSALSSRFLLVILPRVKLLRPLSNQPNQS